MQWTKSLFSLSYKQEIFPNKSSLLLQKENLCAEASPLPGFSKESIEDLVDISIQEIDSLSQHLKDAFIPPSVPPSFAFALLSLQTEERKAFSIPFCALLMGSYEQIIAQAEKRKECRSFKIKLSSLELFSAIELIKAIKQKYPKQHLRLDCNRRWSLEEALTFASFFSKNDFTYIEEPCEKIDDLITFAQLTSFSIAADESIRELSFNDLFSLPIKALILKPSLIGDVRPYIKEAEKKNLDVVFSSSFESSFALNAIARLSQKYSSFDPGIDTFEWITDDLLKKKPYYLHGKLFFPSLQINQKKLCSVQ